jgi:hypothetical protein
MPRGHVGSGGIAPPFLTSELGFTPGEIAPGTHWIGGWMGPSASLDAVEKRQILPLPGIEPRPSSRSPSQLRKMFKINVIFRFKQKYFFALIMKPLQGHNVSVWENSLTPRLPTYVPTANLCM